MTKKTKRVKRAKIPRELRREVGPISFAGIERPKFGGLAYICLRRETPYFDARDCRRLAQWLIKAAEYLEGK